MYTTADNCRLLQYIIKHNRKFGVLLYKQYYTVFAPAGLVVLPVWIVSLCPLDLHMCMIFMLVLYTPTGMSRYIYIHPDTSRYVLLQDRVHQARYTLRYTQVSGTAWIASVPSLRSLYPTPKIKCAKCTKIWHNFEENIEFYCLPIDSSSDSLWDLHMIIRY